MSARIKECGSPAKLFRPAMVAPEADPVSIDQFTPDEEFAAVAGYAAAPADGIAGARCAYNRQVAVAAYHLAEQRGFEPGHELDDRLAAEALVAATERG